MPSARRPLRRTVSALVSACLLSACAGSPTAATPPTDPGAPTISCPIAPAAVQSPDGLGVVILYGVPTVANGATPLTGPTCTPASGTTFPVGATTVTCTVTDFKARTNSCTFTATVLSPPKISLTRFLSFGDSMTAGEVVSEGSTGFRPKIVDPALAYPSDLFRDLAIRYRTQDPYVCDAGVSGETTAAGLARIASTISGGSGQCPGPPAQVLLLMEGANDIPGGTLAIPPAAANIQLMIHAGKAAGLKVYLGTLPPENPNACTGSAAFAGCIARNSGAPFVGAYNDVMKVIAATESVPLVDVYAAFNGDVTTLIDTDGLHPTPGGYQTIADAFFASIRQTLELTATSSSPNRTRSPFLSPRRR